MNNVCNYVMTGGSSSLRASFVSGMVSCFAVPLILYVLHS